jgi:hypothetical protein
MTGEEQVAREELDIDHYPGKWKVARQMAANPRTYEDNRHLLSYWERARLFYLELGGELISGRRV